MAEVEHILGAVVVLLRQPIYSLGLGCVINVFRTAQALNIGLEIGAEKDNLYLKPDLTVTHFLLCPISEHSVLDKPYIRQLS